MKCLPKCDLSIFAGIIFFFILVTLAFLVACISNGDDGVLLTQDGEIPISPPTVTLESTATTGPTPVPRLAASHTPAVTAISEVTASPTPVSEPTPSLAPTPTPTATPMPVVVAKPASLTGVTRVRSPLYRYENEAVVDEVRALLSGQNDFVANFYRQLAQEEKGNLFYSPYSLYVAMGVVYAGAAEGTALEFQEVMGIAVPPDRFHRNLNSLDLTLLNDSVRPGEEDTEEAGSRPSLSVANGLWIQEGIEVLPGFLNTVTANYGIGLAQLDFRNSPDGAAAAINQWVDQATQGNVKKLITPHSFTDHTSLVVTNAVYFKGDWEYPFDEENTSDQPFYRLDGQEVQVPMMVQKEYCFHQLGEGYQAVKLPYTRGFDLLVVMPDEGTFETFEESLTGERLQAITNNLSGRKVILRMPRFKLEYSFSAKEGLRALGLNDAFDRRRADFSLIAEVMSGLPVKELWIEDAVQKAFVEVNEKGSEAAAAAAFFGGERALSNPPPPLKITIDRPFIFLLSHSETGAVLFMGRVLDPTK